jgi:uncharacterized membrane protein YraQ (UPF0718 family)
LYDFYYETWGVLKESSFYILAGFFFAGIVHYLIPAKSIAKYLGGNKVASVINASILGIPLPLCSCSVIPTALNLKKSGSSKGAVVSFLISTPETGIDSIFITYALMGPIITIARPVAAFFTAAFAGIMEVIFGDGDTASPKETVEEKKECGGCRNNEEIKAKTIRKSLSYVFTDLFKDIYLWFLAGIVIAGAIAALFPKDLFLGYLGSDLLSMMIMLLVSVPMYICATASTPIAAALILKGLSPGAAVVLLLAGPATNMATLTVLLKTLGKRSTVLYLASIILCSLFFGYVINLIYHTFGLDAAVMSYGGDEMIPDIVKTASSYLLLLFSVYTFYRQKYKRCVAPLV